ncbi:putative component of type VI protein secretion system [Bradyrhizobium sp. GM24.11]
MITDVDREAMTRAIAAARRESPARKKQIDGKLARQPWEDVGRYAAFCAQITALGLQPWESTVVYADTPEAHALLRRLAAGLSKYEPDPLGALSLTIFG